MSYQKAEPNFETRAPFDIASLTTSTPAVQETTNVDFTSTTNTFDASAYQTTNLETTTTGTTGFDFTATIQSVEPTPSFDLSS